MELYKEELAKCNYRKYADPIAIEEGDDHLIEEINDEYVSGRHTTILDLELVWGIIDSRTAAHCAKIGNYPTAQFLIS